MDIGLLKVLELLTEVGATANALCLGPDHLKESKPSSLAWVGPPLATVSLYQPSIGEEEPLQPVIQIQAPEDMQLQDRALNRGFGGESKLGEGEFVLTAYSPLPTTHTISPGLSSSENLPF